MFNWFSKQLTKFRTSNNRQPQPITIEQPLNQIQIRDKQIDSSLIKSLPEEIHQHIFSFLNNHTLSQINQTCTLFYIQSKIILKTRLNSSLNTWLTKLDQTLQQKEAFLQKRGEGLREIMIHDSMRLYLRYTPNIHWSEEELSTINFIKKMHASFAELFYTVKLLEGCGVQIDNNFYEKLNDFHTRYNKTIEIILPLNLREIEDQVKAKTNKESQTFDNNYHPRQ